MSIDDSQPKDGMERYTLRNGRVYAQSQREIFRAYPAELATDSLSPRGDGYGVDYFTFKNGLCYQIGLTRTYRPELKETNGAFRARVQQEAQRLSVPASIKPRQGFSLERRDSDYTSGLVEVFHSPVFAPLGANAPEFQKRMHRFAEVVRQLEQGADVSFEMELRAGVYVECRMTLTQRSTTQQTQLSRPGDDRLAGGRPAGRRGKAA